MTASTSQRKVASFGHGLPFLVARYFEKNPTEELDYDSFCIKFNCTRPYAKNVVSQLRASGLIETTLVIRAKK